VYLSQRGWQHLQDRRLNPPEAPQDRQSGGSAELDLLLACARWPQRRLSDRQLIRTYYDKPLDWKRFLRLVQHHRLVPLVFHNLHASAKENSSPELEAVLAELQELSTRSAHQSLRSLAELRRVVRGMENCRIPLRVLKGLPLSKSIFGDLSLRAPGDLDILIDEASIMQADTVLRSFGYRGILKVDRFSPKRLAFYRSHWKDLTYENSETGLQVDLHWRCFRNSKMPGAALCSSGQPEIVSFGGFQVDTPPRLEALLYLCVHGTLDGWLYFKSLVDVAARVRTMNVVQLDALAVLAADYAILPELTATLTLVRRYLGMYHWSQLLLPPTDPTVEHILRYADQTLVRSDFLADREAIPIATTLAFELGLRRNFPYRLELLLRVLFRARMWETIPLPDFLFGIYPLLSPIEWAVFRLRQWRAKPPSNARLAI
jgi:hypothetical protein